MPMKQDIITLRITRRELATILAAKCLIRAPRQL